MLFESKGTSKEVKNHVLKDLHITEIYFKGILCVIANWRQIIWQKAVN